MNHALQFLSRQLNETLKIQFGISGEMVTVGRLKNLDGTFPQGSKNKIVLSVVNISLEDNVRFADSRMGFATQGKVSAQPLLNMNLHVLAASSYDDELEGLKILKQVIQYFQANSFFDQASHPELSEEVQKITVEACNLSLQDVESVWKAIGSNAAPSMLYKLRVQESNGTQVTDNVPAVENLSPKKSN